MIANFLNAYKEVERSRRTHVEGWKGAEEEKAVFD